MAFSFIFFNKFLAQMNSVARMTSANGMTMNAGPGRTMRAMPNTSNVPPMMRTIALLACLRVGMYMCFINGVKYL